MPMIGLMPWLLGLAVEVVGPVQVAVVGHRDRRHAELAGAAEQAVEQRRPVEHGVLGVHVQVHEVVHGTGRSRPTWRRLPHLSGVADGVLSGAVLTGSSAAGRGKDVSLRQCAGHHRQDSPRAQPASRSRGRGRGCLPPGRRRARSRSAPGDVEVARDARQDTRPLVADPPAATLGHQARHQVVEPLAVRLPRGRR